VSAAENAAVAKSTASPVKISSMRQYKAILRKDIVMELRTKEMLTSMGLYAVLVLVVYGVALSQTGAAFDIRVIAAGLLWLAILFTSMLGLNRSLVHEKDQGCLDALLLAPIDRPVIFFAKATGNLIFLSIVEVMVLPLFYLLFLSGKALGGPVWLLPLPLIVGSIGIAGVGTLLATMSVNTTGKDFILAVLFVPVMFPLLYACVAATGAIFSEPIAGLTFADAFWKSLALGAGYDVIMVLAAYALYEFIIGA
jgi:heme exporter protein B